MTVSVTVMKKNPVDEDGKNSMKKERKKRRIK